MSYRPPASGDQELPVLSSRGSYEGRGIEEIVFVILVALFTTCKYLDIRYVDSIYSPAPSPAEVQDRPDNSFPPAASALRPPCWASLPLTSSPGTAAPPQLLCHCFSGTGAFTAIPLRRCENPPGTKAVWKARFVPGLSLMLPSLRGEPRLYCMSSCFERDTK